MTGRPLPRRALLLAALALAAGLASSRAGATAPPRLAVFPFELVDSSLQGEKQGVDLHEEVMIWRHES